MDTFFMLHDKLMEKEKALVPKAEPEAMFDPVDADPEPEPTPKPKKSKPSNKKKVVPEPIEEPEEDPEEDPGESEEVDD